ncbi:MAG TPA: GNAT family N-acetyltransferase, partial [Caldilineaceae bacterium]|nr:GNAT family N-acetyltransferase [Caldilineaceae bacterium]
KPPAPRFYMGRTRAGNLWRFRHDLPAATMDALDRLCRAEPVTADLASPPRAYAAIRAILQDHAPVAGEYRGPAYWIAEDSPPSPSAVLISEENANLLQSSFPWARSLLQAQDAGPVAAAIEQGRAVAICFCSRLPNRAAEAGVETLPAHRGKGYATAAVATWAAEVRRRGILPLYSTSWENLASQRIAHKLRMVLYGEDWSIR